MRKYESGYEKRKKKKRIEELTLSQKGALDKFFVKESNISSINENQEVRVDIENQDVFVDSNANVEANDNVGFTLKSLSSTRWESRVNSVKAIRFQVSDVREALLQIWESDKDLKISSEAKSLADNELSDFEFLLAIVIWYEILYAVNLISKHLQSKDMLIDIAIEKVKGLISYFEGYRESGFELAVETAEKIATEINGDPVFPQRREIKRKRQFDENPNDVSSIAQSSKESFRINYFIYIVDQAIMSLKFHCNNLEVVLKKEEQSDIVGNKLYVELKLLQEFLPKESMGPIEILKFLNRLDCFPNAFIAYRILLTIPVTVASAERSFSKLKLLKTYLRSTMTQERLNGLALIAIENDYLEKIE